VHHCTSIAISPACRESGIDAAAILGPPVRHRLALLSL
jgi:hypothetical protein